MAIGFEPGIGDYAAVRNRIREIRKARGMTLEQVAEAIGTSATQISRLEQSKRRVSDHWIERIAPALGVRPTELLSDEPANPILVPVIGYVGAGEIVETLSGDAPEDWIEPPPRPGAESTEAVIVRGDSMWPAYRPKDRLFFLPATGVPVEAIGQDCVVKLVDGRMYVKTVRKGTRPGVFRLSSYRGPDIEDVSLQWAAPIRWIERPGG